MIDSVRTEIRKHADPEKARFAGRFFKTGKSEYGEGDIFLGITVPQCRKIAQQYKDLPLTDIQKLLYSKLHEERLIALFLLVYNFQKGDDQKKKELFTFYLDHTKYINNWDLVDLSADKIVGEYLYKKGDKALLVNLAHSESLWERRIAMIATYAFIKQGTSAPTFQIADILLHDTQDLIQKAVGWMLRESGKRVSTEELEAFLQTRYHTMPRTALRYAIERFPEEKRKRYLLGSI